MLLIDAGNSRCKWARVGQGAFTHSGVVNNCEWALLQQSFAALPPPSRVIVSNVAGAQVAQELRMLCGHWKVSVEFVVAVREQCGVRNRYDDPGSLGSDRWSALLAAWRRMRKACLVVNCGTATTVDALSDEGEFLGGLIMPGITLMRQSLLQGTAQLRDESGHVQDFPRNSQDAIHSGVLRATLGAIQFQYGLLLAQGAAGCVLSGGAANQILEHLGMPVVYADNLVLEGLQIIGETKV